MRLVALAAFVAATNVAPIATASGQGVTAFKTGEQTTGMTKQCYYSFGASRYTQTVSNINLCPLSIEVPTSPTSVPTASAYAPLPSAPTAVTALKTGERSTGMTKQCYYSFGGSEYTKTVNSVDLCPLSIQVRQ